MKKINKFVFAIGVDSFVSIVKGGNISTLLDQFVYGRIV